MGMVAKQYEVYLIELDPTKGSEIKKTRPCAIISPNEMNKYINTLLIAPMTTKSHDYPTRVQVLFNKKKGWVVLDQIRCIDKTRLKKKLGTLKIEETKQIKSIIKEMLVD